MGGWKTTDGGVVNQIGGSSYSSPISGEVTVLSAAANTNGAIVRTAVCFCNSSYSAGLYVSMPGNPYFVAQNGQGSVNLALPLYVPPGVAIKAWGNGVGAFVYLTWDLL